MIDCGSLEYSHARPHARHGERLDEAAWRHIEVIREFAPLLEGARKLKDERRAMHEGYVFLDEKCLLLAGEILRELADYGELQREFLKLHDDALTALRLAVTRHGLQGPQIYPPADLSPARLRVERRSLMGVRLQQAVLESGDAPAAGAVDHSPEAEACRRAFAAVLAAAAAVAKVSGNLERLSLEYRRAVRRARALQDVMLPELEQTIYEIDSRLEELEREEAIWMRQGASQAIP